MTHIFLKRPIVSCLGVKLGYNFLFLYGFNVERESLKFSLNLNPEADQKVPLNGKKLKMFLCNGTARFKNVNNCLITNI